MGRDFKVDDYGDYVIENGDFVIVEDEEELRQRLQTKLLKIRNEDVYDLDGGVDWFGRMYKFDSERKLLELEIRNVLLSTPEVTGVPRIDILFSEGDPLEIEVAIDSIYGPVSMVNS